MRKKNANGFTLIEVLASISVLLLLVVVTSQLVGAVSSVLRSGKARIDIFTQARITFGELDRDIRQMVLRPDLAAFVDAKGQSDLAFYTRTLGGEGDRAISLVEYRIDNSSTPPVLSRRDYGMDFNTLSSTRVLTFVDNSVPTATPTPTPGLTDLSKNLPNDKVESKELARGVVRLGWQFIDSTGTAADHFIFNYNDPSATTNTRVVQVSLLVLDAVSYDLLIKSGQLPTLLSTTAGPPPTGKSTGQFWEGLIDNDQLPSTIPKPVKQAIRVFERSVTIPINR